MPVDLDFSHIRTYEGSQQLAFEELCCQLARHDFRGQGEFIRKGIPDAGVECYWRLPSGEEWAWQAKYFPDTLEDAQWTQIDRSVSRALETHPNLTRYVVCLPIDRAEPRIPDRQFMMDKWNARVEAWSEEAHERQMSVGFEYWGKSELVDLLAARPHHGRAFYWFNQDILDESWFELRLGEAIESAGPQYTPEVNVELPISQTFDALGGSAAALRELTTTFLRRTAEALQAGDAQSPTEEDGAPDALHQSLDLLLERLNRAQEPDTTRVSWSDIQKQATAAQAVIWDRIAHLNSTDPGEAAAIRSRLETRKSTLRRIVDSIGELLDFTASPQAGLFNTPALLVTGRPGTGKTHLLCDVARRRMVSGHPTVLILGHRFVQGDDPWQRILTTFDLQCTTDEFLGALDAAGEARQCRSLILIDALNEGAGAAFWRDQLPPILTRLQRYPWIAVAFTVRTSYHSLAIQEGLVPLRLVEQEHLGFEGHEWEAVRIYFDHYGIELPNAPLLQAEFANPLFLKLFCKTLQSRGQHALTPGVAGITDLLDEYLNSVNFTVAVRLTYPAQEPVVQGAVKALAAKMATDREPWLNKDDARATANHEMQRRAYPGSLFDALCEEGLLFQDRIFDYQTGDYREAISFGYERLTDHMVVAAILDEHLPPPRPTPTEGPPRPHRSALGMAVCQLPFGWIEALCIQLPELIGLELTEIIPYCVECPSASRFRDAFVQSLVWRRRDAFTDETWRYLNEEVLRYQGSFDGVLEAMVTVAADPAHPLNADRLHRYLTLHDLSSRDAGWTIFINDRYAEYRRSHNPTPIARIIDWAWHSAQRADAGDDVVRLTSTTLAWFLTSSNRFLRDRATKALVALLCDRLDLVEELISKFQQVDDPYVAERLMAAAYGCAMRSADLPSVRALAQTVYAQVFRDGTPPVDIMLRDYARGIVELAARDWPEWDADLEKARPPYASSLPESFPTEEDLSSYDDYTDGMSVAQKAQVSLYHSIVGGSDFARYVLGNDTLSPWSQVRLSEPRLASKDEILADFATSLSPEQTRLWEAYRAALTEFHMAERASRLPVGGDEWWACVADEDQAPDPDADPDTDLDIEPDPDFDPKPPPIPPDHVLDQLRGTLAPERAVILNAEILPLLSVAGDGIKRFESAQAQRWLFARVLELGWRPELFGEYDRFLNRYDYTVHPRTPRKAERIGKKYLWIAFHELLARLADNLHYVGRSYSHTTEDYTGPWQLCASLRDIDPSSLLPRSARDGWGPDQSSWWFTPTIRDWRAIAEHTEWLQREDDLPDLAELIQVCQPANGTSWLSLDAFYLWSEPTPPGQDRYDSPRREAFCILNTYLVRSSDADAFLAWAKDHDFAGRHMPEPSPDTETFLGEYYWSSAYTYHDSPYYGREDWTTIEGDCPAEVQLVSNHYLSETGTYDCSIDETISARLPAKHLALALGLRTPGVEGQFLDQGGQVAAFDPSLQEPGPQALLVRQDALSAALADMDCVPFWILLAEKNIIGGHVEPRPGRLVVSGAYTLKDGKLDGKHTSRYTAE